MQNIYRILYNLRIHKYKINKKTEDNKRKNKNFEDELERSSIRLVLQ